MNKQLNTAYSGEIASRKSNLLVKKFYGAKRWLSLWLVLLLACMLAVGAQAETFEGTMIATETISVLAEGSATVENINAEAGQMVAAGKTLLTYRLSSVFAEWDGTVSWVKAAAGDAVDGTLLEIEPVEKYTIYCTVDHAYESTDSQHVSVGDTVYIKCSKDWSHQAIGRVVGWGSSSYTVETIGGELYKGETVYLYSDEAMTSANRVGKGTVVNTEAQTVEVSGYLQSLKVSRGERVYRGELLGTYATVKETTVTASEDMILTEILVQEGDTTQADQVLFTGVDAQNILAAFTISEEQIDGLSEGQQVWLIYGSDKTETPCPAVLEQLKYDEESGSWQALVKPQEAVWLLGGSVQMRTEP